MAPGEWGYMSFLGFGEDSFSVKEKESFFMGVAHIKVPKCELYIYREK